MELILLNILQHLGYFIKAPPHTRPSVFLSDPRAFEEKNLDWDFPDKSRNLGAVCMDVRVWYLEDLLQGYLRNASLTD